MTTDSKNEPVWVTPEQLEEHIKSLGQPAYDKDSGALKGVSEAPCHGSDIMVRKIEGEIIAVAGSQRLDVQLRQTGEVNVRFLSGRVTTVVRAANGQLVEK